MISTTNNTTEQNTELNNRAFLYGDAVKVYFFVRKSKLIMAEECYFFLMASMRKMRLSIPLTYTLDFFQNFFEKKIAENGITDAFLTFMAYRNTDGKALQRSDVSFHWEISETADVLSLNQNIQIDLLKEISVNTHLLSNIHVHCPENIYAEVYAKENDLDDVILLNPNKRIARCIMGNLLFLEENAIKVPKQTEGAYISPLMENFLTFIHRNRIAEIEQAEMVAFESQKAEEILMISDQKGIFPVGKIRNKIFSNQKFSGMIEQWKQSFNN